MSGVKSLDPAVLAMLEPKVQLIPAEKGAIYLVGPIRLPVNLDGETAEFKWYCWLNCEEVTDHFERIVDKLSSVNLAEYQQSSVLVYGDFENAEHAWIRMHSICHTGDIFGSKRCDCGFQLKQSMTIRSTPTCRWVLPTIPVITAMPSAFSGRCGTSRLLLSRTTRRSWRRCKSPEWTWRAGFRYGGMCPNTMRATCGRK
jgi:hypothetical protein